MSHSHVLRLAEEEEVEKVCEVSTLPAVPSPAMEIIWFSSACSAAVGLEFPAFCSLAPAAFTTASTTVFR